MIEPNHPLPSKADEPKIASITKSTPSKSCLIDPLIRRNDFKVARFPYKNRKLDFRSLGYVYTVLIFMVGLYADASGLI